MIKKHSIVSIVLTLACMLSFVGNAAAYTIFPAQKNEELQEWEFSEDYFKSGSPEESSWGDSYGNKNVWSTSYADSENIKTKAKFSAALGIPQMYIGDLSSNRGSIGYFYFYNPAESSNKSYLEFGRGYSFYLTWTSPIDGVVKLNMTGLSRWAKNFPTYFAIFNNDKEVGELTFGATGENVGKDVSKILKVSKGDTISAKVYLDGENVNGAVLSMKVSQVRTAIMNEDDYNKSWNVLSDFHSSGNPSTSEWGDSYGNNKVWNMSYYDLNESAERSAQFKTSPHPTTWNNPFHSDASCHLYPDGDKFYGETQSLTLGAQSRINWTAPEEGTIVAKLSGECKWGNTTAGVKFTIMKNGEALISENAAGRGTTKNIEQKIMVEKGDVISFATQTITGSEGYRVSAEVEARHGIQITEDPTFIFADENGEAVEAPAEGGSMNVSIPIYNANTAEIGAMVFIALYDENGRLMGIEKVDCGKIPAESEYSASGKIDIEKLPSKAAVYVWDSEVGMKPYYNGSTRNF